MLLDKSFKGYVMKEMKIDINKAVYDLALSLYGSKENVEKCVNELIIEAYNKSKKSLLLEYIRDLKSIIDFIISEKWILGVEWSHDVMYSGIELPSNRHLNFKIKVPIPTLWNSTVHKFEVYVKDCPESTVTAIKIEILNNAIIQVAVTDLNMLDFNRKFNLVYECSSIPVDSWGPTDGPNSSLPGIRDQVWETLNSIFKTNLNAL